MSRFLRFSRRIPVRVPTLPANQKLLAAFVIAISATAIALAIKDWKPTNDVRNAAYDFAFRERRQTDMTSGDIVIVEVDQRSLDRVQEGAIDDSKTGWPWPRELYGDMVAYLAKHGAKVIAFDILFDSNLGATYEVSDGIFADAVNETPVKVVFGTMVSKDGTPKPIVPPVKNPVLGAVNEDPSDDGELHKKSAEQGVSDAALRDESADRRISDGVRRQFRPFWYGYPSLAYRVAEAYSGHAPAWREPFYLHYYGRHRQNDGRKTFRYVSAIDLLGATRGAANQAGIPDDLFKDKIVFIGGTAATLYDAKATPLDDRFPGVEFQATAAQNMLSNQRVIETPTVLWLAYTFFGALLASLGSLMPRRTMAKASAAVLTLVAMALTSLLLFLGNTIYWLPFAVPLIAFILSTVAAFAWSYFTEGRQRAFFSNAFALATSPEVVNEMGRDPNRLKLGGQRRDVTIMFTDLAGFTDFAEKMDVEKLTFVIQTYMEAMSEVIVKQGGYLDKYIGDAIMSSWNGLIDQAGHAASACRAAVGIKRRELEIAEKLRDVAGAPIVTRIGVHTGRVAFGNLGSSRKLQITVLGDSVNLAARLEPANKLYDTEVIISQATAEQVKGLFVVRELDLLAVKGKTIPMAVYELIAEGEATGDVKAKIDLYAEGLAHYRAQRWTDAEASWNRLLKAFPGDGPSTKMLARIEKLRHESLPADWDGVYRSKEK